MTDRMLGVDDDLKLLADLKRALHGQCDITTVSDPKRACDLLIDGQPYAVIVSVIQMPGVSGIELLALAKRRCPETIRIVLTGTADRQTAIDAVNERQIFRFLT